MTQDYGPSPDFSRRRAAALFIVAGIHAALGLLIWQLKLVAPDKRSEPARSLTVQLLPVHPERRTAKKDDLLERKAERSIAQALHPREPLKPVQLPEPAGIWLLAPAPTEPSFQASSQATPQGGYKIGLDGTAVATPGLAASGPAGLNLAPSREVLRGALANPATSDPRSNSPKPTVEERIAMSLDPGLCLLAERLPDGTIRRRMSRWQRVQSTMSAVHGQGQGQARICE
ncbi:hypothetical protein ACFJGW_08130 [Burkholderiaceae bacterium UC74_6]